MGEERKQCLSMDLTFDDNTVNIVGITMKEIEYYTNLVNKAAARFETLDSNVESSTVGKILSSNIMCFLL